MLNRKSIMAASAVAVLFAGVLNRDARAAFLPGEFVTWSQDSWGDDFNNGPAAQLLVDHFDLVYIGGVEVGILGDAGYSMFFSSAAAVLDYLPAGGAPGSLINDLLNPTSSSSGAFGGYVLALQLNVDFNDAGALAGTSDVLFGDLVLHDLATPVGVNGMTVRQFLASANAALGDEFTPQPTLNDLTLLTENLTLAFEGGTPSQFAQDQLAVPDPTLTGDLNADGFVGIADLNLVLGNWNQNVPPGDPLADPSGDGFVGIEDLNTVLGNWNAGTPPGTQSEALTPEPGAGMLTLLGLGTLAYGRASRRP